MRSSLRLLQQFLPALRRSPHDNAAQASGGTGRTLSAGFLLVLACFCLLVSLGLLFISEAPYAWVLRVTRLATGSSNPLSLDQYAILLPRVLPGALFYGALGLSLLLFRRRLASWLSVELRSLRSCLVWYRSAILTTFRTETLAHRSGFAIILLLGVGLRLAYVNEPPRYDESFTYLAFASRSLAHVLTLYTVPNNHILHSLFVWGSCRIFGNSVWAIRLPVLLAGMLLIPLMYAVARRVGGRNASLYAAGFATVSGPLILYSVNARGYTLQAVFLLVMLYVATDIAAESPGGSWLLFSAAAVAGFWTSPTMLYSYLVALAWLLWKGGLRMLHSLFVAGLVTVVVTVFLYMPVVIVSGARSLLANPWVTPLTKPEFLAEARRFPAAFGSFLFSDNPILMPGLLGVGVLLCFLIPRARDGARLFSLVLLVILVLPPLQRIVPFPRVLLPLCALCYLSAAIGWSAFDRALVGKDLPLAVALTLLLFVSGYRLTRSGYIQDHRDFPAGHAVVQFLRDELQPCDRLIISESVGPPLDYQLLREHIPWAGYSSQEGPVGRVLVAASRLDGPLPERGNGLADPSVLTMAGTLRDARLNPANFSPPILIYTNGKAQIFQMMPNHPVPFAPCRVR